MQTSQRLRGCRASHCGRRIATVSALVWIVAFILGLSAISWTSNTPPGTFLGLKLFSTIMTGLSVIVLYANLSWIKRVLVTPLIAMAIHGLVRMWCDLP